MAQGSGTYTGTTSDGWSLSLEHAHFPVRDICGTEITGTSWSGNKLEGSVIGLFRVEFG